ncbi:UNVERIFIED_CONTAM: hypothetical protein K2H54_039765 [Gekko kuhli]
MQDPWPVFGLAAISFSMLDILSSRFNLFHINCLPMHHFSDQAKTDQTHASPPSFLTLIWNYSQNLHCPFFPFDKSEYTHSCNLYLPLSSKPGNRRVFLSVDSACLITLALCGLPH